MDSICYVYWLHRPEHTDIYSEGYIGITNNPGLRFRQHLKSAKAIKSNHKLYNAMSKYADFVMKILVISTRDQCFEIEEKLRPENNIGLNTLRGGYATYLKTTCKATKEKLSVSAKAAYAADPSLAARCGKTNTGRTLTQVHRERISLGGRGKQKAWMNSLADHSVWLLAEEIYQVFLQNPSIGYPSLSKRFGLVVHKTQSMLKLFRNGWNPFTDKDYQTYKRKNLKCH